MRLRDRRVIITGAASGMGRSLAMSLSKEGAQRGLVDRNEEGLRLRSKELASVGRACYWAVADVGKRAEVVAALGRLEENLGRVGILVASAGILKLATAWETALDEVQEIMQVNFYGVIYAINAVLPGMLQRGSGH